MLKVGLTGGIGSGKTYVARIFSQLGIPVYHADERAKVLMHTMPIKTALVNKFGNSIYPEGELDRKALAAIIFNNDEALSFVNALVHPAVKNDFQNWLAGQDAPYVLKEAAILFETGGDAELDQMILVVAPQSLRLHRVLQRDGGSEAQVLERMSKQWPDERKQKRANFCIFNDEEQLLLPQILSVHENLIRTANS